LNDATRIIMERFAPPALLDQQFQVVQFNGQTGVYLQPSPGEPTFDALSSRAGVAHGFARRCRRRVRRGRR
jgi:hypothetical protein